MRPRALARAALAAGLVVPACSIPLADTLMDVSARCDTTSDCGGSGVCFPLPKGNTCVTETGDLAGLVLEVRPLPGASYGAGTSHLVDLAARGVSLQGAIPGGFVVPFDIDLAPLVAISPGQVIADGHFKSDPCLGKDGKSMPADVELRPIAPFVGLSPPSLTASTSKYDGITETYSFDLAVPPGDYDVYVKPLPGVAGCEPPPPLFLGGQTISADARVSIDVPPPSRLTGALQIPAGASVAGWALDIVEPKGGLVVSSVQELGQPSSGDSVPIDLLYYWVDSTTSPIIRLSPPEGAPAPHVYWELSGAAIFGDKNVVLNLTDLDTKPMHIQATVLDERQNPVLATVTIQSKGLSGEAGANAAYTVTTDTGPDGGFEADLLLGKYRVLARPKVDRTKALGLGDWEIKKDDLCCGKVVTVGDKAELRGVVLTPTGEAMSAASVVAEPPLPRPAPFLDQALGLAPVLPDRAQTYPDGAGSFALGVDPDPGASDFAVNFWLRPPDASGFPWLVRPRVLVHKTGTDLGTLTLPYPVVLSGVVRAPDGRPVTETLVRAWLPLTDTSAKLSGTVIQVAETQTDGAGSYVLPLPPSISE